MSGGLVFAPRYRVEVLEGEGVFLLSERGHALLRGRAYERLAPLLDGTRVADELIDELAGDVPVPELYFAIGRMRQQGYVIEAGYERAGWWGELGVEPATAERQLTAGAVAVVGVGEVADECLPALRAALSASGVGVVDPASAAASLLLAVTDDHLRPALADLDDDARRSGRPWLLVRPGGRQLWLGPLLQPGTTACWHCLAQRLRANRDVERFLAARRQTTEPFAAPNDLLPAVIADAATALITLEVLKLLGTATDTSTDAARIVTFDWVTLRRQDHVVVRRPQCPVCGDPTPAAGPVTLSAQPAHHVDGGHRSRSATDTWNRYHHHISPITGAISAIDGVPLGDGRLHVYNAGQNLAIPADSVGTLRSGLRSSSAGKGKSAEQARCSAMCEALERYSGRFDGAEPTRRASMSSLGERAISPNACMLWSDAQYDDPGGWQARHPARINRVPARFDEDAVVDWTPVWSLTNETVRYVPTGYCYYGVDREPDARYYRADSNGNAAGTSLTEAILQGFLELVERDCVAMWWYNRVRRPALDLDSVEDPYVEDLLAEYEQMQREVAVLDVTNDLGIPAFAAVSWRTDGKHERIALGFGAHLDARVGALRALTELNQIVAAIQHFSDTSQALEPDDVEAARWLRSATRAAHPYLVPVDVPPHRLSDFPSQSSDDLAEDVRRCQDIVEARGHELLVLDQTRRDIELPVVKVIVPGLRHFWARLAPGRLYDVPVELGWCPHPTREGDLNPVAMFL